MTLVSSSSRQRLVQYLACVALLAVYGCAATSSMPDIPSSETVVRRSGIAALSPVFADYRLGTTRPGGEACTGASSTMELRYVESLEYFDVPPVAFGLDGDCIVELRAETGQFSHALSYATERLGTPDGEDQARCTATRETIDTVYWTLPEGRFELVRVGVGLTAEYVLRRADAPMNYGGLCEGGVER